MNGASRRTLRDLDRKMFRLFRSKKSHASAPTEPHRSGYQLPADLVDPRVMDQIGHLELLSRTVVDGLLAGKHRSTTKGGCCEFAQHRQYAPGDEIRQIDWQVYARNDRYFIRQFEEETNLHGILAIDTSGSMKFGHSTVSKPTNFRHSTIRRVSANILFPHTCSNHSQVFKLAQLC